MRNFKNADKKLKYKNNYYYAYYEDMFFGKKLIIVDENNKKILSKKISESWIIFNDNNILEFKSILDNIFNKKVEVQNDNFMDLDKI